MLLFLSIIKTSSRQKVHLYVMSTTNLLYNNVTVSFNNKNFDSTKKTFVCDVDYKSTFTRSKNKVKDFKKYRFEPLIG